MRSFLRSSLRMLVSGAATFCQGTLLKKGEETESWDFNFHFATNRREEHPTASLADIYEKKHPTALHYMSV